VAYHFFTYKMVVGILVYMYNWG